MKYDFLKIVELQNYLVHVVIKIFGRKRKRIYNMKISRIYLVYGMHQLVMNYYEFHKQIKHVIQFVLLEMEK
jgi:hypothetical protein